MAMRTYAPQILTFTAVETAAKYFRLEAGTDRHQVHVGFAAAGNALTAHVAAPPKGTDGTVPEPGDVDAKDWVPISWTPANSDRLIVVCVGRYLRLTPNAAGTGQAVQAGYQPMPPTSP